MSPVDTLIRKSTRDMSRNELTHHVTQLREALTVALSDRDMLAAEVESWRRAFDEQTGKQIGDSSDCRDVSAARSATDASGALTRAKEDK
jgi:hypothetical protein